MGYTSNNPLKNAGQMVTITQSMSLSDLVPESWINNKYQNTIDRPRYDTINDRISSNSNSIKQ